METAVYRIAPSAYAGHVIRMWLRDILVVGALPVSASIIVGAVLDLRFLFVAVILVFLIAPLIMSTVYYYHALSPEASMSILPHRIIFGEKSLTIKYEREPSDEDAQSEETETTTEPKVRPDDTIPLNDIKKASRHGSDILLNLTGGKYRILVIPINAIPREFSLSYFINTR